MSQSVAWVPSFAPKPTVVSHTAARCPLRQGMARAPVRMAASGTEASASSTAAKTAVKWDGSKINVEPLLEKVKFNSAGLVAAIAQQVDTKEVLMMAWMNEESIRETMHTGRAVYFSRSRQRLWRKGESSGQVQHLLDFVLDCDGDTILLSVDQIGVACHTGRRSCFYNAYRPPFGEVEIISDVLIDPTDLYGAAAKK